MAIRLKQTGVEDFVVFERDEEVGGTWWANTYPGCQCDIPSHLYSYSFALNPEWTRTYPLQPEIRDYLRECADRYGVRPHLRLRLRRSSGPSGTRRRRSGGSRRTKARSRPQVVIAAPGAAQRAIGSPRFPGIESFGGTVFHTAALEPRPRPDRAQGGGGRHRRERDPDRPADPADRRARDGLPAHPAVGRPAPRPADHRLRAGALPPRAGGPAGGADRRLPRPRAARAPAWPTARS